MYVELPKGEARTAVRTSVRMFTSELQPDACWNGSFHPYQTTPSQLSSCLLNAIDFGIYHDATSEVNPSLLA
jgi:hypothetical protein